MKKLLIVSAIILVSAFITSTCNLAPTDMLPHSNPDDPEYENPLGSSSKEITSFVFTSPDVAGNIDEENKTISATVPYGTDVTNLSPAITHTGVSISPASGGAEDFSEPVTYTVTAEDTTTASYTATVTVTDILSEPVLSPAGGTYNDVQTVTITADPGTTIYYTTDDSDPVSSVSHSQYSGTVAVDTSMVIRAVAMKSGLDNSAEASETYILQPEAPVFSPSGGTYSSAQSVTITCPTAGTTFYYTTDDSDPASSGTRTEYTAAVNVDTSITLKAVSEKPGWDSSSPASETYIIPYWQYVGTSGFSPGEASYTLSLALDSNDTPYTVFRDSDSSGKATVMKYNGTDWEILGSAGFSEAGGKIDYACIALTGDDVPYVAYSDDPTFGSGVGRVRMFNGTNWDLVGGGAFSSGKAIFISLALDSSDTPYVIYQDDANSDKAAVKRFNGTSWESVGSATISPGYASICNIAFDNSNVPYVVYRDALDSDKAVVKKYNGTAWETVGSGGCTDGAAGGKLAFDSSNRPYLAFGDGTVNFKATVIRFNGTLWEDVGSAGFSAGQAGFLTFAIDSLDTPYVAYRDGGNSNKATVMKFNSTSWEAVGSAGFTPGRADDTTIVIDSTNTPFLAYSDYENGAKAVVVKFAP